MTFDEWTTIANRIIQELNKTGDEITYDTACDLRRALNAIIDDDKCRKAAQAALKELEREAHDS